MVVAADVLLGTALTMYLEEAGHAVVLAEGPDQATRLLADEPPQLAVVDGSPATVAEAVIAGLRQRRIGVILLTDDAAGTDDATESPLRLEKPFEPRRLAAAVAELAGSMCA